MRIIVVVAFYFAIHSIGIAETFITENFEIVVESKCAEGNVTCNDVVFNISTIGNTEKQTYVGSTMHSVCSDNATPCSFQGYKFKSSDAEYFLHQSGVLEILDLKGNPLLLELGVWKY